MYPCKPKAQLGVALTGTQTAPDGSKKTSVLSKPLCSLCSLWLKNVLKPADSCRQQLYSLYRPADSCRQQLYSLYNPRKQLSTAVVQCVQTPPQLSTAVVQTVQTPPTSVDSSCTVVGSLLTGVYANRRLMPPVNKVSLRRAA